MGSKHFSNCCSIHSSYLQKKTLAVGFVTICKAVSDHSALTTSIKSDEHPFMTTYCHPSVMKEWIHARSLPQMSQDLPERACPRPNRAHLRHDGKYQAEVRHLAQASIALIMGLFEVPITVMMLICGANNIKINIT